MTADKYFEEASDAEDSGDIVTAMRLYRLSSKLGCTHAMTNLACYYVLSSDFKEISKGIRLFKKAFRLGNSIGAYNLAQFYRRKHNKYWYVFWLRRAAQMGDKEAAEEIEPALSGSFAMPQDFATKLDSLKTAETPE